MPLQNKKLFLLIISIFLILPLSSISAQGLVPCGQGSDVGNACTLCHFIIGIQKVVSYGLTILIITATVAIFISGVIYIISSGNEGAVTRAKGFLKASLVGFSIILLAWFIVNIVMTLLSVQWETIDKTNWHTFTCNTKSSAGAGEYTPEEQKPPGTLTPIDLPDNLAQGPDPVQMTDPTGTERPEESWTDPPYQCFADGYEGEGTRDANGLWIYYPSLYDKNGVDFRNTYGENYINPQEAIHPEYDTYDIRQSFGGCASHYQGTSLSGGEGFRVYIPPGTTRADVISFQSINYQLGWVARWQQPPSGEYKNYYAEEEWRALPWPGNSEGIGGSLTQMKDEDSLTKNLGGHSYITRTFLSSPLDEGGWLYLRGMVGPETSAEMPCLVVNTFVDKAIYTEWLDNPENFNGGNPVPTLGPSTDDCK